jgi:hypothetical protein
MSSAERGVVEGRGRPAARSCATCGLATPPGRTYCTPVCRTLQHRYARALARVPELTTTAMESEELDRPEFAEREWVLVQAAVDRLAVMQERIREARSAAGLEVPSDWP